MKKLSLLQWLLLVPAFFLLLLCLGLMVLVLSFAPPAASWGAFGLFVVVAVWFFLVRRRGAGSSSEASLMGRQSTKDGLL